MERKPGLITFVQVMLWISVGLVGLVTCLTLSVSGKLDMPPGAQTLLSVSLIVSIAMAILNAIIAVNLGQRRNWARVTGIAVCAIGAALDVVSMVAASGQNLGGGNIASPCINLIVNLVVLGALASEDAKGWCTD